jgi:hypothetical protein
MKRIGLYIVFTFLYIISFSQNSTPFRDTLSYPNDLVFLMGSTISNNDEFTLNEFRTKWKSDFFSDNEKGLILKVSRNWFSRKAIGIHYLTLVNFILISKKNENAQKYLIPFLEYFNTYIIKRQTTLNSANNLLRIYSGLITDNYLFNTGATKWKFSGGSVQLAGDTGQLFFRCTKGNLTCYSKHDSIWINETSGEFYPLENIWKGKDGIVTWERCGFTPEDVKVVLKTYSIVLNKNEYTSDSAVLYYKKYFSYPVTGKLNDKVMQLTGKDCSTYPEFDSYSKRFFLKDLYENIDYDGGISLKGARIIGSGNEQEDAKIVVKRANKTLMEVRSKYFVFRPEKVNGLNSSVKILLDRDSIYHSDQNFLYYVDKKEVNLQRSDNYSSRSPYFNSYHKVDMIFDQLTWRIDQTKINLGMSRGSTMGRARFVSQSFYNQGEFEKLQGRSDTHPLVQLNKYAKINYNDEFTASAFADYVGRPVEQVRQLIMAIAEKGFIYYNSNNDYIKIKKRLYDYLKASGGKVDYDVVDFVSLVEAPKDNAVLDMETYDLTINGMPLVMVSDSQNVAIYPANEQLILKQNRSFQFDGKVEAGLLTFHGSNFFFNYEEFKINLQNVDVASIRVFTSQRDNFGKLVTRELKNSIKHITGDLLVDRPDNKSGRKTLTEYPLFRSRENSFVYYQYPDIEGGVYPEESFYFEVDPFTLDSLDNFTKEGLSFSGKFHSSDILPVLDEKLKVQPDYSLGFKFNPGAGGIPVYKGKAKLFAKIDLSSKGLRADGKLDFLTSTTLSNDFKFYPDSMNTQSKDFSIAQQITGTQFPKVNSRENYIHWDTRFDAMYISQGKDPFKMFNPETVLTGSLVLEPKGLSGNGKMDLTTADLYSNNFMYKANVIDADTSAFNLKSLHTKGFTVQTQNVRSHVDFTVHKGEFTSNEDYSLVTFPENQYISYLDYFKWNMNDKTLEMGAKRAPSRLKTKKDIILPKDTLSSGRNVYDRFSFKEEPVGPRYISTHRKQDSLNFIAPLAVYNYEKNLLNASNVKLIRVADAIIYTKDGKVTIAENAQMKTLYDTKIVAGYENKYHTIHSADVNIFGRFSFTGQGKYDYIDETKGKQVVQMKDIKVDTTGNTIAAATVIEQDTFKLSPNFAFQGRIELNSSRQLLTFNGGATIITECSKPAFHWIKFKTEIDPNDIYIPVDEKPVNINNGDIYNGIFIANDSIHVYPAFLSGRRNYNDKFIVNSSGFLRYNKDSALFEIASIEKLKNRDSTGNYLNYHKYNCIEYGDGQLNLGVNLGQVKLNTFGTASFNTINKEVKLSVLLAIDFMFDPVIIKNMANKIDSFPDLMGLDITEPLYTNMQNQIMGRIKGEKYREEMLLLGKPKEMPADMLHTLNITSLNLRWNHETRSYQSIGKIGVGNILNTQINKLVEGFIEITKRRSGDYMDIYLKLDAKNYYYFGYTRGVMQAYSSDNGFVNAIRNLSLKQRQMDIAKGETSYIYMVSSDSRMRNFFRNYQRYQKGEATQDIPGDVTPTENQQPEAKEQPNAEQSPATEQQNVPQKEKEEDSKKEEKVIEVH